MKNWSTKILWLSLFSLVIKLPIFLPKVYPPLVLLNYGPTYGYASHLLVGSRLLTYIARSVAKYDGKSPHISSSYHGMSLKDIALHISSNQALTHRIADYVGKQYMGIQPTCSTHIRKKKIPRRVAHSYHKGKLSHRNRSCIASKIKFANYYLVFPFTSFLTYTHM